jgi:DNA-binding beta-propeller fold protein YncE
VTHPSANALTIIDIPSGAITYFTIGANPRGVVVDTLTSRVYVANAGSNNVVSFLPSNPDARQTIGLPAGFGAAPWHCLAGVNEWLLSPTSRTASVTPELSSLIRRHK